MAEQTKIRADLSQLESLLKQIGGEYVTRVGILGSDAGTIHDTESGLTNSELGLIHEFGSETNGIPARSFLRMPIETQQQDLIDALDTGKVKEKIEDGDILGIYRILGQEAVSIVKDSFLTGGNGQWEPNANITINGGWMNNKVTGQPVYIKGKKTSKPLLDTGMLQRSITFDVVKKSEL